MKIDFELDNARKADDVDPLACFRERFLIPKRTNDTDVTYLCGNSLGLQPKTAGTLIQEELDLWAEMAVKAHFHSSRPWISYQERLAPALAHLVGCNPNEVVAMNTLTVNLHLMMVSFYRPSRERWKILIEDPAFPSDRYAVESQIRFHGFDPDEALIEMKPRLGESTIRMEDLERQIRSDGSTIALILMPGINYYTGQRFDIEQLVRLGREAGCVVGFDLAHAVGNVPMSLHEWNVDFAVWCSYKYLNGGPGAIAGCFVHDRHSQSTELPRLAGWWGNKQSTRFAMDRHFEPSSGAEGWQVSNAPILSLAPVLASLRIFEEVGLTALRAKSERLTSYFTQLVSQRLGSRVDILTPTQPEQRGCQLSLRVRGTRTEQQRVFEALQAHDVICDWREPDVIRAAPVPLYNRYEDIYEFVTVVEQALTLDK